MTNCSHKLKLKELFNTAPQIVEKLPEPSKHSIKKESLFGFKFFFRFLICISSKPLMILRFDFLREPHSAVPLYADEYVSLGFVAFSTVSGVSKNTFPTRRGAV